MSFPADRDRRDADLMQRLLLTRRPPSLLRRLLARIRRLLRLS